MNPMKSNLLYNEGTSFSNKVLKGFLWLGTGTFLGQTLSWLSTIIVIRLLAPSDYGLMAMAGTFVMLLTMISEFGIGVSIIQAEHINEIEIGQIFTVVIMFGILGWLLCYFAAPLIALFYNENKLIQIIRIANLSFLLIPLYVIPQALFGREMNFKIKAKINLISQVGGAILTLIFAWQKMGVWSLVFGLIAMHLIKAIGYNYVRDSWIKPILNLKNTWKFIKFGSAVTADRFLYYLFVQSDKIIVGKFLGNGILGIYAVALNLASIPAEKVLPIISQISFTSFSRIQDDLPRIKRNILRAIRVVAVVSFPVFLGMACVAPEAIPLILGNNWQNLVVPFQLLCLVLPFKALSPILPPAVFAIGRPKVNLINMVITAIFMTIAFILGVRHGLVGVCISWIVAFPIVFLITSLRCLKVLELPFKEFISTLIFPLFASLLMAGLILLLKLTLVNFSSQVTLGIMIIFGIAFYGVMIFLFNKNEYIELKNLLKRS